MAVYGYVRVSTIQQAKDGESLDTQIKQIQSYSVLKGFDIDSESFIIEKGISGNLEFDHRPEGAKLLSKLIKGDVLIFSKLDRGFRNTRNALNTLYDLKDRGVSVHFIDLGGDITTDAIGSVIFTILSAFATFERERIATRIREVKQIQKSEGKFLGGYIRYGFYLEGDRLVKDDQQQKIIKEMRDMKRRGMSLRRLSRWLDKNHQVKMAHSTISSILNVKN